jgi:hypothetical protein
MPTPGARRAGQDREAPEGSLDAPKRSRTIEYRSDRAAPLTSTSINLEQSPRRVARMFAIHRHYRHVSESARDDVKRVVALVLDVRLAAVAMHVRGALMRTKSWPDADSDRVTI